MIIFITTGPISLQFKVYEYIAVFIFVFIIFQRDTTCVNFY